MIRAAITLKLNAFDDTGAIVAAMTTSIPEAAGQRAQLGLPLLLAARRLLRRQRAQPPRRDAHDGALPRLHHQHRRAAATARCSRCTASAAAPELDEREVDDAARLPRHGPGARRQPGLAPGPARRLRLGDPRGDARVLRPAAACDRGDDALFQRLEPLGRARGRGARPARRRPLGAARHGARAHVLERDVLGGVRPAGADRRAPGPAERAALLARRTPTASTRVICERAWNAKRDSFVATIDGDTLDASLLLLAELGFLRADDPRFAGTVAAIERELKRGDFIFRYIEPDDFGAPENAFLVCTFWYVDALARARPPRRGARAVRGHARAAATATACSPSTSIRRPASCGATSCRPTAWSA